MSQDKELDEYANLLAGGRPSNFQEISDLALKLNEYVFTLLGIENDKNIFTEGHEKTLDKLRDAFLMAAYSYSALRNQGNGELDSGFIQRAKQVTDWMETNPSDTPLVILHRQARELARIISSRLFGNTGFVLVIFNMEATGNTTYITNIDRKSTIDLLTELVLRMKRDDTNDYRH